MNAPHNLLADPASTLAVSNDSLEIQLSRTSGKLTAIILKARNHLWNSFEGNLIVKDDLARREYNEEKDQCTVIAAATSENLLSVEKRFAGSCFTVLEKWSSEQGFLKWRCSVVLDKGTEARSIEIRHRVPWHENNYGTGIWGASSNLPSTTNRMANTCIEYGGVDYGIVIPLLAFYRPEKDIGLSIAKPLGMRVPRMRFCIPHWNEYGPEVEFSLLRLDESRPAEVELIFAAHQGDWRPSLQWFYDLYPEYFDPPSPDVGKLEGGYLESFPSLPKETFEIAKRFGVKWAEVHYHFPFYGNYIPDEEEWTNARAQEDPDDARGGVVNKDMVRGHCAEAMANGIHPLLYFQCAGDGYKPYVDAQFPESIAVNRDGRKMPSWINCRQMNSDSSTGFGQHIRGQIDRIYEQYPDIGGVFLDQLCYDGIDFAHDDGITMCENRPCYKLVFAYLDTVKKLAEETHGRGKLLVANGPFNIEVQRYVDGHMAEALSWVAHVFKYLCIAKPLLFCSIYRTAEEAEFMLKNCLLLGAWYSVNPFVVNTKVEKAFSSYLPLLEKLKGRKWLLEPNPLTPPENNEANIFRATDGSIIVTLVKSRSSIFDTAGMTKDVRVSVHVKEAPSIRHATCMGVEYQGERELRIEHGAPSEPTCMYHYCPTKEPEARRDDITLSVTLPSHGSASMIILRR